MRKVFEMNGPRSKSFTHNVPMLAIACLRNFANLASSSSSLAVATNSPVAGSITSCERIRPSKYSSGTSKVAMFFFSSSFTWRAVIRLPASTTTSPLITKSKFRVSPRRRSATNSHSMLSLLDKWKVLISKKSFKICSLL